MLTEHGPILLFDDSEQPFPFHPQSVPLPPDFLYQFQEDLHFHALPWVFPWGCRWFYLGLPATVARVHPEQFSRVNFIASVLCLSGGKPAGLDGAGYGGLRHARLFRRLS
jgi:hypothetical protein